MATAVIQIQLLLNQDEDSNTIILPTPGEFVRPQDLQQLFEELLVEELYSLEEDFAAAVLQPQSLLNQKDLQALSKTLVSTSLQR